MKLCLAVLLLIAAPAFAQTGDCAAETGTSTTWAITDNLTSVTIRYTFYAGGVSGQLEVERNAVVEDGTDIIAFADSLCRSVDLSRVADERLAARGMVYLNQAAQLVQPAYPERCTTVYPAPLNATPGNGAVEFCRLAEFHQALMRELWPDDALPIFEYFQDIMSWLNSNAQQGGAAFNTTQKQQWLAVTSSQWATQVSPRMNNINAIASGLLTDATQTQWREPLD